MDIAGLSIAMSQANVQQQVSFGLMNKVMDQSERQGSNLLKMLDQPMHPHLGQSIDIKG
ncbi:YjfB family protein [Oceanobacillus sp. 1P07AA]|uniref:YjfB family protein n=1 Tax=Oceanobacillus sp. 1P07AA TaxID=3132293 RepID=UPI0039A401C2